MKPADMIRTGRLYSCVHCEWARYMTLGEQWRHMREFHPDKITVIA